MLTEQREQTPDGHTVESEFSPSWGELCPRSLLPHERRAMSKRSARGTRAMSADTKTEMHAMQSTKETAG